MLILTSSLILHGMLAKADTPYTQHATLAIQGADLGSAQVQQYGIEEINVNLQASFDNPFDPSDVALDAQIKTPSGKTFSIPGFFSQDFDRKMGSDGKEINTAKGSPKWLVRVCGSEVGTYQVVLSAKDHSGSVQYKPITFAVTSSTDPGFIRISSRDRRYFEFDNHQAYLPIGANVCWGGNGTFSYDKLFNDYGAAHANFSRVWLGPSWATFAIIQPGNVQDGKGPNMIDLGKAWRLDYTMALARKNNLYVMFTIDSYNDLKTKNGDPTWDKSPMNQANGGPLHNPADFWQDNDAQKAYDAKLRYLIARYSADTHVMSWELWNEVDSTDGYNTRAVSQWHQRIGDELNGLDPYRHLRCTSYGNAVGDQHLDEINQLDFVETHYYGPDPAGQVAFRDIQKASYGKAHLFTEVGADSTGPKVKEDPTGIQVHDPQWSALVTGSSGTAIPWWWDTLIVKNNLYPLFTSVKNFTDGIDWPSEGFRATAPAFLPTDPSAPPVTRDLLLTDLPQDWVDSPLNSPRQITIDSQGNVQGGPIGGVLHGVRNHSSWHNPATFNVQVTQPTHFEVQVGNVSGSGGAGLTIDVDGSRVLTQNFPAIPGQKTITTYAGSYGVDITPGNHTIIVNNPGNDWMNVGYRFANLLVIKGAPLQGWAMVGNTHAIVWTELLGRTWRQATAGPALPPAPPSNLSLSGLKPGSWKAEIWDTWKGVVTQTSNIQIGQDGVASVPLPAVTSDLAVKLSRQ